MTGFQQIVQGDQNTDPNASVASNTQDTLSNTQPTLGGKNVTSSQNQRMVSQGNVTVTSNDGYIIVRKIVGSATSVVLPATYPTTQTLIIKDGKGDAAINNITVASINGALIDGQANFVLNVNYSALSLIFDGKYWNIV